MLKQTMFLTCIHQSILQTLMHEGELFGEKKNFCTVAASGNHHKTHDIMLH